MKWSTRELVINNIKGILPTFLWAICKTIALTKKVPQRQAKSSRSYNKGPKTKRKEKAKPKMDKPKI